jgi:hypothetical protein
MSVDQFLLSADTTDLNYPDIRPTLDLNFARVKTLDPRITFTRASGGSYVGADGLIKYAGVNEARFDHDPVTGESLGLLVEESRSNLMRPSEDFTTWGKPSSTIVNPNVIIAPDGTLTADKLVEGATEVNSLHYVFRTFSITPGVTYTVSGYVKSAERNEVFLNFSSLNGAFDNNSSAYFNTTTGKFRAIGSSVTNFGSQSLPNGWYRVWITATSIGTTGSSIISPFLLSNGVTVFYRGDGASGIYVWGAQLEVGAFPTSYIPTQGSTRTRASDNASITGKNFSEWYRPDEGTVYSSYITRVPANANQNNADFVIENETSTNRIIGWNNFVKQSVFSLVENNIANYVFNGALPKINIPVKKIIGVQDSNVKIYVGTDALIGDFASGVPDKTPRNLTRMFIGVGNGFSALNGTISRLTYFPKRLPNAQLQALTR